MRTPSNIFLPIFFLGTFAFMGPCFGQQLYYNEVKAALAQGKCLQRRLHIEQAGSIAFPLGTQQLLRQVDAAQIYVAGFGSNAVQEVVMPGLRALFLAQESLETLYQQYILRHGVASRMYVMSRKEVPQLYNLIAQCAQTYSIPVPLIIVADDDNLLTAAAGAVQNDAALLFIGSGLLNKLDAEQFHAVVCHELAHIAQDHMSNRVFVSFLLSLLLFLLFMGFFLRVSFSYGYFSLQWRSIFMFTVLCLSVWYGMRMVSTLTQYGLKVYARSCEYEADALSFKRSPALPKVLQRLAELNEDDQAARQVGYDAVKSAIDAQGPDWLQKHLLAVAKQHQEASVVARHERSGEHPTFAQRQAALKG